MGEESSAAQRGDASADRKCGAGTAPDGDQDAAVFWVGLRNRSRVARLRQENRQDHLGDASARPYPDAARSADGRAHDVSVQGEAVHRCRGRRESWNPDGNTTRGVRDTGSAEAGSAAHSRLRSADGSCLRNSEILEFALIRNADYK